MSSTPPPPPPSAPPSLPDKAKLPTPKPVVIASSSSSSPSSAAAPAPPPPPPSAATSTSEQQQPMIIFPQLQAPFPLSVEIATKKRKHPSTTTSAADKKKHHHRHHHHAHQQQYTQRLQVVTPTVDDTQTATAEQQQQQQAVVLVSNKTKRTNKKKKSSHKTEKRKKSEQSQQQQWMADPEELVKSLRSGESIAVSMSSLMGASKDEEDEEQDEESDVSGDTTSSSDQDDDEDEDEEEDDYDQASHSDDDDDSDDSEEEEEDDDVVLKLTQPKDSRTTVLSTSSVAAPFLVPKEEEQQQQQQPMRTDVQSQLLFPLATDGTTTKSPPLPALAAAASAVAAAASNACGAIKPPQLAMLLKLAGQQQQNAATALAAVNPSATSPTDAKAQAQRIQNLLQPLVQLKSILEPMVTEFSKMSSSSSSSSQQQMTGQEAAVARKPTMELAPPTQFDTLMQVNNLATAPSATTPTATTSTTFALSSSTSAGALVQQPWGNLVSAVPAQPGYCFTAQDTTIGKSSKCGITIPDKGLHNILCRIQRAPLAIESLSNQVFVEGNQISKGNVVFIKDGDTLKFQSPTKNHVFNLRLSPAYAAEMQAQQQKIQQQQIDQQLEAFHKALATQTAAKKPTNEPPQPPATSAAEAVASALEQIKTKMAQAVEQHAQPMDVSADKTQQQQQQQQQQAARIATFQFVAGMSPAEAPAYSLLKDKYKEMFKAKLIRPDDIKADLEHFTYYLSEDVRRMLISSAFVFLRRPEFANKFGSELSSLSRKILVIGPNGTELYQEALVKALAKYFSTHILVLEATDLEPRANRVNNEVHSATATTSQQTAAAAATSAAVAARGFASAVLGTLTGTGAASATGGNNNNNNDGFSSDDDDDAAPEPRALFLDSRLSVKDPLRLGLGRTSSTMALKKGDRVRFTGSALSLLNSVLTGNKERGPLPGSKGTVVVTFEEIPRKVGVQFDKPIPGGVDLGGMCKDQHGFFVDSASLACEDDTAEDESAAIEAAFEVINEAPLPAILLIKNAEKVMLVSHERYALFKKMLSDISKSDKPIIVMGTTTTPVETAIKDMKQKHAGLLAKAGHSAVVDFSFLDHLRGGGGGGSGGEDRAPSGPSREVTKSARLLAKLFPTRVPITVPKDSQKLCEWREQIDHDIETVKFATNTAAITKALAKNNVVIKEELQLPALKKQIFPPEAIDKIVGWAISDHLQHHEAVNIAGGGDLIVGVESLKHAMAMLEASEPDSRKRSLMEVETENDFEKRLLAEVIPPEEVNLSFDDIGALDEVKDTLRELVMLPLQRPELFRKGNLTKPCKGILMFGPPGTGKTMLAKAVATESGANFINVTMSSIASKWFGEGEKYVKAVFTLASKIAPSVIFVDEVDSILGKRERQGEHEAMRKIKNEFMINWDGLRTRQAERVLVLAATNRPMDLDDAVLRRLNKRLLVDLPTTENREKIFRVILKGEDLAPDFDIAALAKKAEGYSGSDLKNLCVMAAHQPIRELLQREKEEKLKKAAAAATAAASLAASSVSATPQPVDGTSITPAQPSTPTTGINTTPQGPPSSSSSSTTTTITTTTTTTTTTKKVGVLRALCMEDFEKSMQEVSKSVHEDAFSLAELRRWNEMYGDSGNRSNPHLSYYL